MFRWREQKKRYRRYQARVEQLPESYRMAVFAIERYMNYQGGVGDAESVLLMREDLADLFEQGAANGTPVREIVGEDPVEFISTFLANYPAGRWIVRERDRLVTAVEEAEKTGNVTR